MLFLYIKKKYTQWGNIVIFKLKKNSRGISVIFVKKEKLFQGNSVIWGNFVNLKIKLKLTGRGNYVIWGKFVINFYFFENHYLV